MISITALQVSWHDNGRSFDVLNFVKNNCKFYSEVSAEVGTSCHDVFSLSRRQKVSGCCHSYVTSVSSVLSESLGTTHSPLKGAQILSLGVWDWELSGSLGSLQYKSGGAGPPSQHTGGWGRTMLSSMSAWASKQCSSKVGDRRVSTSHRSSRLR